MGYIMVVGSESGCAALQSKRYSSKWRANSFLLRLFLLPLLRQNHLNHHSPNPAPAAAAAVHAFTTAAERQPPPPLTQQPPPPPLPSTGTTPASAGSQAPAPIVPPQMHQHQLQGSSSSSSSVDDACSVFQACRNLQIRAFKGPKPQDETADLQPL